MAAGWGGEVELESSLKNTTGEETPYFSTGQIGNSTDSSQCGHYDMSEQYRDKKEETRGQHQGSDFPDFRGNVLKGDEKSVDKELANAFGNKCSYIENAVVCCSPQLDVNDEKVDKQGMQTEHVSNGNTYFNLGHDLRANDLNFDALKFVEESEDKEESVNAYLSVLKTIHSNDKDLKKMWDKEIVIKGYGNAGNAYSEIGQYDKAIHCHGRHLKTAEGLYDKRGVGRDYNNLGNAYNNSRQYEHALDCKRESVKKDLGDKEGVGIRTQSDIVGELEDKQTVKRISRNIESARNGSAQDEKFMPIQYKTMELGIKGVGGAQVQPKYPVNCKCSLILENSSYNLDIVQRFQQPIVPPDCDIELHSLKQPLMGSNTVVILTELRTHGIAIVNYTAPIVMVTFQKCANAESDGLAEEHACCVCRKVFAAIENVLRGENREICTVKTCQENSPNKLSEDTRGSTDAEIINEIESLVTELCQSKESMTRKLVADIFQPEADESATKSISLVNQTEAILSKEFADMRRKHQEIVRQLLKIKEKVCRRTNAGAFAGEAKNKGIKADTAMLERETQDVCPTFSQDIEISQTTGTTSGGVQQQIETVASSEETATTSEGSATSSEETTSKSEGFATSSGETATSSEGSATSSEETATSSGETATSSEETDTSSGETATSSEGSDTSIEETSTSSEETATSSEETAASSEETATTSEGSATTSEDAATKSEERYPVAKLQLYFSRHLLEKDWFRLRRAMPCSIPENVLSSIPNDISLFEELVKRNLINDQNMDLLRQAFYEIKRIDCVHFIDCSKCGEYLNEFENVEEDREGVATMGQQNNQSVSAVQDVPGISDERSHQPAGATGFQTPVDVKDGAERFVGSDVFERLSITRNKAGAQLDKRDIPGKYTNSPTKSLKVPVQEVIPGANPFLPGSNGMKSRHRDEAAAQSEERTRHRGGSSQGGAIQDERCNAGSHIGEIHETGTWNDVSLKTGSNKTGSNKTGSNTTRCNKTGSNKTGSNKTGSNDTGSYKTGNFETGTSKTGNSEAGSSKTGSSRGAIGRDGSTWAEGEKGTGNMERANDVKWSCGHYERYCDVQFDCCEEFWPCHRCHNAESKCEEKKLRSRDITKIKCKRCSRVQEFPKENPNCIECGLKFSEYFCAPCQHLTGKENHPFHCEGCGICRINEDRSFHCDVCGVCLDVNLLENHICRPDSAHDQCCICFEDAFNGCQILPCSHKIHKDCARMMLNNGITTCPVCRQSFAHKLQHRPPIRK